MATNFVQMGHFVTVPAPSGGVTSNDPVLIGSLFGVALATAAQGDAVSMATAGVFRLPKTASGDASEAWSLGDPVYFDPATGKLTKVPGALQRVGVCLVAAANDAALAVVRLDGIAR